MSGAKRLLEQAEDQRRIALEILVGAKVAEPCPAHGHLVYRNLDPTPAYIRANARWRRDAKLRDLFGTVRELTDEIKSIFETDASDRCPHGECPWPPGS